MADDRVQRIYSGSSLESVGLHDHLCLLYNSLEDILSFVVPYFQSGLARGEQCVYLADDFPTEQILERLQAGGVDVQALLACGQLLVVRAEQAYLRSGRFDPEAMWPLLNQMVQECKAKGFRALRAAAEMSWAVSGAPGSENLLAYEGQATAHLDKMDMVGLCLYARRRFRPHLLQALLRAHPLVVVDNKPCRNPSYMPPQDFLSPDPHSVDRMLRRAAEWERTFQAAQEMERARAQMTSSRQELQAVHDSTPVLLCVLDQHREIVYANRAFGEFVGLPPERLRTQRACGVLGCIHSSEDPRGCGYGQTCGYCTLRQAIDDTLARGVAHRAIEYRTIIEMDSHRREVVLMGSTSLISDAPDRRILLCLVDVTEQKQTETRLQEALAELSAIHAHSPIAMFVIDRDHRVQKANHAALTFTARSDTQIVGMRGGEALRCLHHLDNPAGCGAGEFCQVCPVRNAVMEAFRTGRVNDPFEAWLPVRVGEQTRQVCLLITLGYVRFDGIERVLVCAQDVTASKRAEQSLRGSEEALRKSQEIAHVGSWRLDLRTNHLEWSDEAYRIFGMTAGQVSLSYEVFLSRVHPEDRTTVDAAFRRAVATGTSYEVVHRLIRPDGTVRYVQERSENLCDPSGQPLLSMGIVHDITRVRQAEMIVEARLRLLEYAADHTLQEVLQKTLDEVAELTGSLVGFFHFVHADEKTLSLQAWSTPTLKEFCNAQGQGLHYSLDQAGVWADCIRQRRAVIHNDYASVPHRKGLPPGHVPVTRELVVPIARAGRIVAVLGVGNRPTDYVPEDVELVTLFADLAWDVTQRKRAEEALRASVEEKEVLLREVHHRVKNNLAAVIGLLHLQQQAMGADKATIALGDLAARIRAMALVHEKLYRSDNLSRIDFQEYLQSLLSHLRTSFSRRADLLCRLECPVALSLDQAIPCGMIVNELVTNALKHAFPTDLPPGCPPELVVHMAHADGRFTLTIADNGVGLPEGVEPGNAGTLGLRLVRMLGEHQLGGQIAFSRQGGTQFTLTFAARNPS